MKCCGKEMYDNINNFHCAVCGRRIYKNVLEICPICKNSLYINTDNIHCVKCGYRKNIYNE